jgi:ABC-2 type transport system ATP-binding protein
VGILSDNVEGLMYDITKKTVGPANFKSLGKELKLEVQLGNANELLQVLTQRGQVTHFVEKIPSVNDILFKQ